MFNTSTKDPLVQALLSNLANAEHILSGRVQGDQTTAFCSVNHCKDLADHGDSDAQVCFGFILYKGLGVSVDYLEAYRYFQQSADQGNLYGLLYLGHCHKYGRGVPTNREEADRYYELAANGGLEDAQRLSIPEGDQTSERNV